MIADVTAPSLGVEYEIAKAEKWEKPILLLFKAIQGRKPSTMLNGNSRVYIMKYTDDNEALEAVERLLKK